MSAVADWRTYAKAARSTARKQAPELARLAQESARRSTRRAGQYTRAAVRAADEGTRDSRDSARRSAAAYATVTGRTLKRARVGERLLAAFRDAVLMGLSISVIWFVVTRTGIAIPFSPVLVVILLLMVLRFGWALWAGLGGEDEELADEEQFREGTAEGTGERSFDARAEEPVRRTRTARDR